jgi:hypothetical protein
MIRFRIVVARVYADSLVARRLTRGVYCCSIRGVSRVIVIAAVLWLFARRGRHSGV